LSDIHSNLSALRECLRVAADSNVNRYICLGDIVGYGASPNECCELVRALPGQFIRGNHDEAAIQPGKEMWFTPAARACITWTREVLTDANRDFLESLPPEDHVDGTVLCHGSLPNPDLYTTTPEEALLSFQVMEGRLAFFGHTHYAEWFRYEGGIEPPAEEARPRGGFLKLAADARYLVNPGGVGQPRDGNPQASFAIWDSTAGTVEILRVEYDVVETQKRMFEVGLPENMALRLGLGI
jgi:diadenosine tetraphosphatase ApaH/serine/threonine PP2A family protein phosphatase